MKLLKENWFKIIIIIVLLVVASAYALGQYAYYQKQQAQIQLNREKQEEELKSKKREQLDKVIKEEANKEQVQKEYIAKQKKECYNIYLQEKEQWNNVEDFSYSESRDVCVVIYKSNEPAKSKEECSKITKNILEIKSASLREMLSRNYLNCLENTFSKEF